MNLFKQPVPGKYKESSDGRQLVYPVENNISNKLKATLFGQYSVPEAGQYYNNTRTPLSAKQTVAVESLSAKGANPQVVYNQLLDLRNFKKKSDEIKSIRSNKNLTKIQQDLLIKLIYAKNK